MISGIATLVCMLAFLGVVWWAYGSARRHRFEEASRIPLEERSTIEAEERQQAGKGGAA